MKKDKLTGIINDLNRAEKMKKEFSEITAKISDPIKEIIKYGLDHSIISSTADVVYVSKNVSDSVTDKLIEMFDEYNRIKEEERRSYPEELRYAGVYESLEELNAKFGTDFNNRCIPNGVIIKSGIGTNNRC